jgi:S-formylglutathione hydrolase
MNLETLSSSKSHGGIQRVCRHLSRETGTEMTFAVFLPPQAQTRSCATLTYLSGLTCTHANVVEKGEYRAAAAEFGLMIVCPDTSPRGAGVPDHDAYDFGQGAGFYVDATETPWSEHFRMYSYITRELPPLVRAEFRTDPSRQGIFGHSMGGHGALTIALRSPDTYRTVSAFSPIVAPSKVPWGRKAFAGYLGENEQSWRAYDTVSLLEDSYRVDEILVDVGTADQFLERELRPELLETACERANVALTLRRHPGYDHSYFFISTFMRDHIAWHAARLGD